MFRATKTTIPYLFHERFKDISHQHQTKNCHRQNLLYHLLDLVFGTMHLLSFKSNLALKLVLRIQLKKRSSNYTMGSF